MINNQLQQIILKFLSTTKSKGTYLETGFLHGDSVQAALNLGFNNVISIEINKKFVEAGEKRFYEEIKQKKVKIYLGDSSKMIKKLFGKKISIIFLDAHGYYNEGNKDKEIAPLEQELKFIIRNLGENQMLIVDDYIKIKHSFLFAQGDWKSRFSNKELKNIISNQKILSFELPYKSNSYLILTKNKKFKLSLFFRLNIFFKYIFYITFYLEFFKLFTFHNFRRKPKRTSP